MVARSTCLCLLLLASAAAADITIEPSFMVSEIATDNVNLDSANAQDEYITQLLPAVTVRSTGRKLRLDINYARESLFFYRDSSRNSGFNNLNANASAELQENTFFVEASGLIRQQVIDNQGAIILDNINPAARTNITSYTVGPRLRSHLGSFADSEIDFRFGRVIYDNTSLLSDADITRLNAEMHSGRRFNRITWRLQYDFSETRRAAGDKSRFETASAQLQGRLTQRLEWVTRAELINDDVQGVRGLQSGVILSAGMIWRPNSALETGFNYGNNYRDYYLAYQANDRTRLRLEYRDVIYGTNPGARWRGGLEIITRRYVWKASYGEDTSNLQSLEFAGGGASQTSIAGGRIYRDALIFDPTDEDFIRRSLQAGLVIKSARSTIDLNASRERRDFLGRDKDDLLLVGNMALGWDLSRRSTFTFGLGYIARRFGSSGVEDSNWYASLVLARNISRRISGKIDLRRIERDEAGSEDADYAENRASLSITVRL